MIIDCRDVWPGAQVAAVSLTFDDGHPSQLQHAVPLMEDRGLRGTFYISAREDNYVETLLPWKDLADRGHEIGNHSFSHTCSRNFSNDTEAKGLERSTLDEIEADILRTEQRLQEIIPAVERSFAYPCYQTDVGEGLTRQSYVPVIARHFAAARGIGEYGFANSPVNSDLHCLWSHNAEHCRGTELIGLVRKAMKRGHWIIFAFHSIEGGRLGIAEYEFSELLDFLADERESVWTAPVVDVARFCREARAQYR
ncbi:MAG: polysaccharide deacetylase family protein [Armatimonadetes bacterium]|nr:polysaccharide deacetylase family protein [Armatimonadota bacterium]